MKQPILVPAVPGIIPRDPTGAGDAYRAGFFYGYLRGWDLVTCASLGSVAAAYTVELVGTQTHRFTHKAFAARFRSAYGAKIHL